VTAVALLVVVGAATHAQAEPARFWVWNRSSPLSDSEENALRSLGVTTLYWQIGQLDCEKQEWRWRSKNSPPRSALSVRRRKINLTPSPNRSRN
jgi:hypothetical protein